MLQARLTGRPLPDGIHQGSGRGGPATHSFWFGFGALVFILGWDDSGVGVGGGL